jgi:acyl transferase domain-containing protein/acyl carrier protein
MNVEIIGRACITPGAQSPEALFALLKARQCAVTAIPEDRWDQARYWHPVIGTTGKTYTFAAGVIDNFYAFDPAVFGMSHREAMYLDPQQRLVLELTWRALEDANIDHASVRGENVGVYVGASSLDHANLMAEDPAAAGPYFMSGNTLSVVSNRISHIFGLSGPSLTIDTACSSSLIALDQAVKALETGVIDTAIVGGVSILSHPLPFVGFAQARMLSADGLCRAYDDRGIGYVRAEGGAVFVLRRSDKALAARDRSYATIVASGANAAGRTNGISLPSREAQATLLRSLYDDNLIDVGKLAFVEGHGTGTKVGDPAEIWSIGTVIGSRRTAPIPVGSIKSNIGHTEPASGVLGLMKAVLALEHNYLPASLHFEVPNEDIDFKGLNVHVASEPIELLKGKQPRFAGINSFGFGGANAHVVISDPQLPRPAAPAAGGRGVFMASAQSPESLERLLVSYKTAFAAVAERERDALVSAAGANRPHLKNRFVVRAEKADDVVRAIDEHLAGQPSRNAEIAEAARDQAKVAFVFSGNGSQWAGMAVDAFRNNSYFRQRFTAISALFQLNSELVLSELLFDPALDTLLADTKIAQPLLFAIQAALSDTLVKLGIVPSAVFGHSVGEVAAAYASGAISLVDAVSVVAKRSLHQDQLAGRGKMVAALVDPQTAEALAQEHGLHDLCVAAYNAHNSVTMSGPADQVGAFRDAARRRKIPASILDIDYPFHHPMIDMARDAFLADIPDISLRPWEIPFISTVTGGVLEGTALDSDYWWRNVREPVAFQAGCEAALALGCTLFVEIGPRPVLNAYLKEAIKQGSAPGSAIPSLNKDERGLSTDPVSRAFCRAIAHGAAFDKPRIFGERNALVALPPLPFEKTDIRPARTSDAVNLYGREGAPAHTLAGWRVDPESGNWKNHTDAHLYPDLAEHVVDGKAILPGSGFIEIAISAARQYFSTDRVEISNLEIVRPLELGSDKIMELSTVLSRETGDLEIRSRERLSEDGWSVHAVARCQPLTISDRPAPLAPARAGSLGTITAEAAYETARKFGLDYGPRFRLLEKAVRIDERTIDVTLKAPSKPGNPYVRYALHPISVDAAFHGLVALFDDLTGDERGAPYIPVRFGRARIERADETIHRARIEIRRVSAYSIKVDFTFLDKSGATLATFTDCRFRRTYLRQHKPLSALAFHYDAVPSPHILGQTSADATPPRIALPTVFDVQAVGEPSNTSLLLKAAVYRACYDIASMLSDGGRAVRPDLITQRGGFRSFLMSCLYTLEDAGFARAEGDGWVLAHDCALPAPDAILRELSRESSERVVEAVLINDTYREAMARIAAGDEEIERHDFLGDATLQHLRLHGLAAVERGQLVERALGKALADLASSAAGAPRVVEFGSVSPSLSTRLAAITRAAGGTFIAVEADDRARHALDLAFEGDPFSLAVASLREAGRADIVLSASSDLYAALSTTVGAQAELADLIGSGILIAAGEAPNAVGDFALGLSDGWFSASQDPLYPVGRHASDADWKNLLDKIGLTAGHVEEIELESGPVVLVAASGTAKSASREGAAALQAVVLDAGGSFGQAGAIDLSTAEEARAKLLIEDTVRSAIAEQRPLIYVPDLAAAAEDGSERLQDGVAHLSAIAEAFRLDLDVTDDERRPALAVVLPKGSPTAANDEQIADPVATGLWAFARVLQNEYPFLHVCLFDAPVAAIDRITGLIAQAPENREWTLDAEGRLHEIRAVSGARPLAADRTSDFEAATIRQKVSSQIASIGWEACDRPEPGADQIVIEVAATGLNFRDVMWGMGLLPEEALEDGFAGATIGMECSGRITAIGASVTGFEIGDTVMAIGPAAFSTHVRVDAKGVARLPGSIDLVAGATLPVAFLTAYYAMVELGRIKASDTILIHGGAGGVGLAALQVAKAMGATVIATAGTVEKRRFLSMLGADHVFDSRSLDFVNDVLAVTNGEGVELVLNSLFGEAMERSIGLVKPFGRFLELGKRDYYADSKIGLRPFRRNVSYFGIDADQLLTNQPELTARLFGDISRLFEDGTLYPLPYRAFSHDEIGNAFRLMQGAGHIGKIVVRPPVAGVDAVSSATPVPVRFDPKGMHLIVGGIGGFGLAAADWLVQRGARMIALCSRRGVADEATAAAIARWKKAGVSASVHACDITDAGATAALLAKLRAVAPLKTILHAAMVLDDALITNLDRRRNRPVIDAKARGAALLDRLTQDDALEHFILFSSATTLVGNPGQANYVAANGYLEGLARARRQAGKPALAIGFGAIADTGFLASNAAVGDLLAKRLGKTAMKAADALDQVAAYLANDPRTPDAAVVMISEIDWAAAQNLAIVKTPLFETIMRSAEHQGAGGDGGDLDLVALLADKSAEEGEQILFDLVASEIAAILRIPVESISRTKVLKEIGLDSLMAIEVGLNFQQRTGFEMPLGGVADTTTIGDITQKLREKIAKAAGLDPASATPAPAPTTSVVIGLAERHAAMEKAERAGA